MINKQNKKMYFFLLVMTLLISIGFQGWRTVFNNFAVEDIGITGQQIGIIQSFREVPGFLALLVIYLLLIIREHKLAALSLLIFGIGIGITGLLDSFWGLVISTLIMSFGFHYYETLNQSLTLQYFSKTAAPLLITKLKSIGAGTNIAVGAVLFLTSKYLSYPQILLIVAIVVSAGACWCLLQNPSDKNMPVQHKKMILRKRYWLFYVLTMLAGARRQIFVAFAVFLLVAKFKFSVQEITVLFVLNNIVNYLFLPYVGKLINFKGERFVLSLEYASLIAIFIMYAIADSKLVAGSMYVLDHMFFGFSVAINSYFQKTSDPKDIAPSMAVGFTINHIAAVVLPAIGGLLWMINYKIPFIMGAVLSLCSLCFVQLIKTENLEADTKTTPQIEAKV